MSLSLLVGIHKNEAFDIMSEATFDRVMGVNLVREKTMGEAVGY